MERLILLWGRREIRQVLRGCYGYDVEYLALGLFNSCRGFALIGVNLRFLPLFNYCPRFLRRSSSKKPRRNQ